MFSQESLYYHKNLHVSKKKLPEKYENIHQLLQQCVDIYPFRKLEYEPWYYEPDYKPMGAFYDPKAQVESQLESQLESQMESQPEPSDAPLPEPTGRRVHIRVFKYFQKLPLEVRRMIWVECAHIPRVVQFAAYDPMAVPSLVPRRWRPRLRSLKKCKICVGVFVRAGGKVPMILQVNKEARKEGMRFYEKPFEDVLGQYSPYFNFAADTIHIESFRAGEVLFGDSRTTNPFDRPSCSCPPVDSNSKDNLTGRLRHLSTAALPIYGQMFFDPPIFSLHKFSHLITCTVGWSVIKSIICLTQDGKLKQLEEWLGSAQTMTAGKPALRHLTPGAYEDFLKVPKIKGAKEWKATFLKKNLKKPRKEQSST